jgi:hypothetical protein
MLIAKARNICTNTKDFEEDVKECPYGLDSTTIYLCLSVFWWASFRKKGCRTLHLEFKIPGYGWNDGEK